MNNFLLTKSTLRFIKNHQAEKILKSIVEYNAELEFDDIMNLVEYEYSIKNLSPMFIQEENNLFTFANQEEKNKIMKDIELELNTLSLIKQLLQSEKLNESISKGFVENDSNEEVDKNNE